MKVIFVCIVFAALCSLGLTLPPMEDELKQYRDECLKKNGLTESDFEIFKKEDLKPEDISNEVKCATHCILFSGGYMNAEGKFIPEAVKPKLNEKELKDFEEAYPKCDGIKTNNHCQTSFLTIGCMMKSGKAN